MSDPGEHGVPSPTAQAEDAWWDAVYEPTERGPAHHAGTGTVDDWFASALGAIGADAPPLPPPPRLPVDDEDLPPITEPPVPDAPQPPQLPREPEPEFDLEIDHDVLAADATDTEDAGRTPEPAPPAAPPLAPPSDPRDDPRRARGLDGQPVAAGEAAVGDDPGEAPQAGDPDGAPPLAPPSALPGDPRTGPRQGGPVAAPPHVPTPTLPDGAGLRWGRSRPAAGVPLPEPDALPEADPEDLGGLVPDTVLELARHGSMTLRAASARGEDARALGAPRGDRMLVARFGDGPDGLLVTAVASGPGATEAVRMLAASVGRSRSGLLADLRHGAQEQLRFGLQRLTARAARGLGPAGAIHALLAPLDPTNRLRAGFGTGAGALLLLGDDAWYDAYAGRRLTNEPESAADAVAPQAGQFRFRAVVPEPGDVLLLCTEGLATPLRAEPAVAALLAEHWCQPHAPAGVDFLRQIQARASGHSGDRTAAAIWEE